MVFPALTPEELRALTEGKCPDCGATDKWQQGPEGGLSENWRCGDCGSQFNIGPAPAFHERVSEPSPWHNCPEHVWAGERIQIGQLVSIATCSLCGSPALPASEIIALRKVIR